MPDNRFIDIYVAVLLLAFVLSACGKTHNVVSVTELNLAAANLDKVSNSSKCNVDNGKEYLIDLNQDGVSDIRKVYKIIDARELLACREADMNFDGIKDMFVFYDDNEEIVYSETDLDHDGQIDIISTYADGKPIKQEIDTNSDGKVDRVRYMTEDIALLEYCPEND